jgi:hypothetical protein
MNYYNSETLLEQQAEIEKLKSKNQSLAAQVEVLQSWLRQVAELINLDGGTAIDWLIDTHQEMLSATLSTPAACLAQVRAEAGRAGFVAGAEWWAKCELEDTLHLDEQSAANQYAESIRQGGADNHSLEESLDYAERIRREVK